MGYSTASTCEFSWRRDVSPAITAFLSSIESEPWSIPVFADWLEDERADRADRVRQCRSYREVHAVFHALASEHAAYLRRFKRTRRMARNPEVARSPPDPGREAAGLPRG